MTRTLNATDLFEQPDRAFHNSESWWTSLFSMLLLYLARHPGKAELPIKKYVSSPVWEYVRLDSLNCAALTFSNLLVEARLTTKLFQGLDWPKQFRDLKPDITICQPQQMRVTLIENKTIGAGLGKQLELYLAVKKYLQENGWDAKLLLLISIGYEKDSEWKTIEKNRIRLVLWEDVLRVVDGIDYFRALFDVDLKPYYEIPQRG